MLDFNQEFFGEYRIMVYCNVINILQFLSKNDNIIYTTENNMCIITEYLWLQTKDFGNKYMKLF